MKKIIKKILDIFFSVKEGDHSIINIVNNTYDSIKLNTRGGTYIDPKEIYNDSEFIKKLENIKKNIKID